MKTFSCTHNIILVAVKKGFLTYTLFFDFENGVLAKHSLI